jgi:hypothetical protein
MRAASKTAAAVSRRGRTKQMPATIPAEQAIAAQSTPRALGWRVGLSRNALGAGGARGGVRVGFGGIHRRDV